MTKEYRIMAEILPRLAGEHILNCGFSRTKQDYRSREMTGHCLDDIRIPQVAYSHPNLACNVIVAMPMPEQIRQYHAGFEGKELIEKPRTLVIMNPWKIAPEADSGIISLDFLGEQDNLVRNFMGSISCHFALVGKSHFYTITNERGSNVFETIIEP